MTTFTYYSTCYSFYGLTSLNPSMAILLSVKIFPLWFAPAKPNQINKLSPPLPPPTHFPTPKINTSHHIAEVSPLSLYPGVTNTNTLPQEPI